MVSPFTFQNHYNKNMKGKKVYTIEIHGGYYPRQLLHSSMLSSYHLLSLSPAFQCSHSILYAVPLLSYCIAIIYFLMTSCLDCKLLENGDHIIPESALLRSNTS